MSATIELPKGLRTLTGVPADSKYYNNADAPYTNTAEVLSELVAGVRYKGLTVNVAGTEYWFETGTADLDLTEKSYGGGGTWGTIGGTLSDQTDLNSALSGKEPTFSKNTGFNKNFGITSGTVSEGNHSHTFTSLTSKPTTLSGFGITDAYTKTESDGNYLGKTSKASDSDKLDGIDSSQFLRSDGNDSTTAGMLTIGSAFRIQNNGASPMIKFNNGTNDMNLYRNGSNIYLQQSSGDITVYKIWSSDNDGAGSGLAADTLDGFHAASSGNYFNVVPTISASGVMEIGKYVDFHLSGSDTGDTDGRITLTGTNAWSFGGTITATSTITATNFILSSDKRLKTKIKDIEPEYFHIPWKTFELKEELGQKRYGVIAQELEKTNPEFVRTDGDGMKSVAYIDLLIAKNAELERRLERLEKLMAKIKI